MNYITITTEQKETYSSISNYFIDYYMTHANGEFVKIYLYLVRLMSSKEPVSVTTIAEHFHLTQKEICRAIKYWIGQEVLRLEYNDKKELSGIKLLPLKDKSGEEVSDFDELSLLGSYFEEPKVKTEIQKSTDIEQASKAEEQRVNEEKPIAKEPSVEISVPKKAYLNAELLKKKSEDKVISDLIFETEAYFARTLSASDIESLIYMHDQLGLSQELIEYLIEYSIGNGKPFLSYMEKVATAWYEKGINTVDMAKEDSKNYNPMYRAIFKELGIYRTIVTSAESAYIEAWTREMGFSEEIILTACRKAILAKPQSANFSYVNAILENWHKKGVKSIRDVELIDQEFYQKKAENNTLAKAGSKNPNGFASFNQTDLSEDLDKLEKMLADELNSQKKS